MSFEEGNQPPVPSLPASAILSSHPISPTRTGFAHGSAAPATAPVQSGSVVQTRVYIGDMQRFNVVEAGPETNARDVLDMLGRQGDLRGEARLSSSWMLYEVCHDYGMGVFFFLFCGFLCWYSVLTIILNVLLSDIRRASNSRL